MVRRKDSIPARKRVGYLLVFAGLLLSGCLEDFLNKYENKGLALMPRDYFDGAVDLVEPVSFRQFPDQDSLYMVVSLRGGLTVVSGQEGVWQASEFENVPVLYGEDGGLLGFTFHPDYATNRKYYVYYTEPPAPGTLVLAEREADSTLLHGSGKEERRLLTLKKPKVWHNGGALAFGADGYLYTAIGDGGGYVSLDTYDRVQNPSRLFGKFLRLDVDGEDAFPEDITRNYAVPPDNPFIDSAGYLPEIWALGVRSPWKWTFHPYTGEIWLGDVGQSTHEEITRVPAGANLGWPVWEGTACVNQGNYDDKPAASECPAEGFLPPVISLPRRTSSSVTGGVFHPESMETPLSGTYIFGDYITGKVWALLNPDGVSKDYREIARVPGVVSFDLDAQGRMFATSFRNQKVYILERPVPPKPQAQL
jgi:glucose/arabinose dehydrogenase